MLGDNLIPIPWEGQEKWDGNETTNQSLYKKPPHSMLGDNLIPILWEGQEKWAGNETSWAHIWEQRISNSMYS